MTAKNSGEKMGILLVTGAGGVLGTAVTKKLREEKREFVAILNRSDCDLENYAQLDDFFQRHKPCEVIHLAGSVYGVGGNLAFPADIYKSNTVINTNMVELSRIHRVKKFVGMGTTAMYSDGLSMPFLEEDVLVSQPHSSERFYAYAKRGMLMHLEACKLQYGLDFCMLLSTNLYGPNDRFDEAHGHVVPSLISKFIRSAENGIGFSVWGDGSPTRDFLYSEDAADGIMLVLDIGSGVYNLASGRSLKIKELVEVMQVFFPKAVYKWDTSKPLGQLERSYNINKIRLLGFHAKTSLQDGIAATLDWYMQNSGRLRC